MTTTSDIHALLRQDLLSFVRKVFATLNPGTPYLHNWHIEAIVALLDRVMAGETRRVMVNVPPRTLKSMIVSIAWPAFLLGHDPTRKIFVVSHGLDLAEEHHAAFRKVVESEWYRAAFPTMSPAAEKDTALVFRTSRGGQRKAFSVESRITGQGADIIILDDPLDASDAQSDLACAKVNDWIVNVLMGRFNTGATGIMVLVMQRLALNDPAARLQEIEPWTLLSLPAIADEDMTVEVGPGEYRVFARGDLLHPRLLDRAYLDQRRRAMGSAAYSAQYQQRPLPSGGGMIDVGLFRRYRTLPKTWDTRFLSIDAASGSESGSCSVIQYWLIGDGCIHLAGSQRGHWSFPELRRRAIDAKTNFQADFFLIELASNGQALAEELWDCYPRAERARVIQGFRPKHAKPVRMDLAMVPIEAGRVFLPEQADWLPALLAELEAFPNGTNDDQVDALSQALWFYSHRYAVNRHNPDYRSRSRVIFPRSL